MKDEKGQKLQKIKVGITHGDINSISYEVILKTLVDTRILEICTPILYGSAKVAAYHRKLLNITNFSFNNIRTPDEANPKRANLINCVDDEIRVEIGKSTREAGEAAIIALETAVNDLLNNKIDVLVTGPINKFNVQSDRFNFSGHTDYLQSVFSSSGVLMLMVNEIMKIGVVTEHIPLAKIPDYITKEIVLKKINILNKSLIEDFLIRKPRIAVLGLNPHAGDDGLLGDEEKTVIGPAIEEAQQNGIQAFGPFSPDGFFGAAMYKKFDAVLAMYHDQGLIPFKALMIEGGVNYTAGLPIVRTSPAHGTSYDIAGKGEASPDSFRKALYLACDIYKNRLITREINKNPLYKNN